MMHHVAIVAFVNSLPDRNVVELMRHNHRHKKMHFLILKERILHQART